MFTGIIQELGTVKKISKEKKVVSLQIQAKLSSKVKKGDSVAVDGACLTVVRKTKTAFFVEVIPESIKRTIISSYKKGTKVNLELPMKLSDRLHGHFVLGHVDGIGKVSGDAKITPPKSLLKHIAHKGSITINGVSLTVSKKSSTSFSVALIPETIRSTNLGSLNIGDSVNLEIDLLSRYLDSLKS
ncbi:riboflavin synthase [Pseudomonadota bacterium]